MAKVAKEAKMAGQVSKVGRAACLLARFLRQPLLHGNSQ